MTTDFRLFSGMPWMNQKTCHQDDCVREDQKSSTPSSVSPMTSRSLESISDYCSIQSTDRESGDSVSRFRMASFRGRTSSMLTSAAVAVGTGSTSTAERQRCCSQSTIADPRSTTLRFAEPGCLTQADVVTLIRVSALSVGLV